MWLMSENWGETWKTPNFRVYPCHWRQPPFPPGSLTWMFLETFKECEVIPSHEYPSDYFYTIPGFCTFPFFIPHLVNLESLELLGWVCIRSQAIDAKTARVRSYRATIVPSATFGGGLVKGSAGWFGQLLVWLSLRHFFQTVFVWKISTYHDNMYIYIYTCIYVYLCICICNFPFFWKRLLLMNHILE